MSKNEDDFRRMLEARGPRPKKSPSVGVRMILWLAYKTQNIDMKVSYPFWMCVFFGLQIIIIHVLSKLGHHNSLALGGFLAIVITLILLTVHIVFRNWRKS